MNKNTLKSIGAVLAGFITVFVLSVGTDLILKYVYEPKFGFSAFPFSSTDDAWIS